MYQEKEKETKKRPGNAHISLSIIKKLKLRWRILKNIEPRKLSRMFQLGRDLTCLKIDFGEEHFEFLLEFGCGRDERVFRVAIAVSFRHDPPNVVGELHRVAVHQVAHLLLDLENQG